MFEQQNQEVYNFPTFDYQQYTNNKEQLIDKENDYQQSSSLNINYTQKNKIKNHFQPKAFIDIIRQQYQKNVCAHQQIEENLFNQQNISQNNEGSISDFLISNRKQKKALLDQPPQLKFDEPNFQNLQNSSQPINVFGPSQTDQQQNIDESNQNDQHLRTKLEPRKFLQIEVSKKFSQYQKSKKGRPDETKVLIQNYNKIAANKLQKFIKSQRNSKFFFERTRVMQNLRKECSKSIKNASKFYQSLDPYAQRQLGYFFRSSQLAQKCMEASMCQLNTKLMMIKYLPKVQQWQTRQWKLPKWK